MREKFLDTKKSERENCFTAGRVELAEIIPSKKRTKLDVSAEI
ncbi:MAG: hypothetical protein U9M97_03205 [Candidatus Hadarchaeota archaeon]|nr:hypothetical protein [Candidatus Hadarchaeota archaeon]